MLKDGCLRADGRQGVKDPHYSPGYSGDLYFCILFTSVSIAVAITSPFNGRANYGVVNILRKVLWLISLPCLTLKGGNECTQMISGPFQQVLIDQLNIGMSV
jgi:hypothetical protein